ncbi:MAG: hypothetical protein EXS01_05490 [Phycisphaerales bacterium]|nr:hypothetical protein [Phycisphaerales bacterium]
MATGLCVIAMTGCYQKTIRVKRGGESTKVADPDFNDEPTVIDELMWGPVPKGQDPGAYYRKKNQPFSD